MSDLQSLCSDRQTQHHFSVESSSGVQLRVSISHIMTKPSYIHCGHVPDPTRASTGMIALKIANVVADKNGDEAYLNPHTTQCITEYIVTFLSKVSWKGNRKEE